ncbi:MAG: Crp/Fnr family transcriptional regulator [Bosea sp. (in: a-proteobacteria)]|uniref:Crp/Fnr family transcriptional regulator n=1 Tax=Bosea sp. (in: a-proteobacteria) TaxID=1871050 RepID=UPI00273306CA|nr:Crp/Fnr family transcriptional regulator [Bosea sp. (in: a-proteobacteria)]MDP3255358.1 Crp/Fnr family transcriptional regulator [Bosea sp. (in: a-proteobacteria)]MDP3321675.1 Crp/Fnr family transcriptional regulator [Bosea sp. (in: a-proteobacteria)]
MIEPMIQHLSARDDLTELDVQLLRSLPLHVRSYDKGHELVQAQSWPKESCLLVEGIAGRELSKADGTRQISALHFAGEIVDAPSFILKQIDHSVVTLTRCKAAFIPHGEIKRITEASPHLARLLWLGTVVDGSIQRAWIAALGRSDALARLSHVLCEIYLRMRMVGQASGDRFEFGLSQAQLADCLGMSPVHINRSMRELRARGLVDWESHEVVIHDWAELVRTAQFDGTYLNLIKLPR